MTDLLQQAVGDRLTVREALPLLVGGEEVRAARTFAAIEPSTGRRWAEVAQAGDEDVDRAVAAAHAAFRSWRRSSPAERQDVLWRIADRLVETADRWPALLATENGRPIREAGLIDVPVAAAVYRYFSGLARSLHGDRVMTESRDALVYTGREPLGVIAALIPWNSPLISLAHKLAPAVATGNAVVVKPSEYASVGVVEFVRSIADLLPPGLVNVVTGDGAAAGAALVAHPGVAKISFTGGTATGARVMAAASDQLTPALMELGGKGALIVCPDADLDTAVTDAMTGVFAANGEVCFASSRLLVHADVYDDVLARFVSVAERIPVGDALDPATQVGPLISAAHRDRVHERVRRAEREGATVRLGGGVPQLGGALAGASSCSPPCSRTTAAAPRRRARSSSGRSSPWSRGPPRTRWWTAPMRPRTGWPTASGPPTSRAPTRWPTAWSPGWCGSTRGSTPRSASPRAASSTAASVARAPPRRCGSTPPPRSSTSASPRSARPCGAAEHPPAARAPHRHRHRVHHRPRSSRWTSS